jgi:hypothetical protein
MGFSFSYVGLVSADDWKPLPMWVEFDIQDGVRLHSIHNSQWQQWDIGLIRRRPACIGLFTTGCIARVLECFACICKHAAGGFHVASSGANRSSRSACACGLDRAHGGLVKIPFRDAAAGGGDGAAYGSGDAAAGGCGGSADTLCGVADGMGGAISGCMGGLAGHECDGGQGG